ncbi:MAG: AraC family transcriptional regulator [Pseudomonadales bacterium]|nr:AraC family transcriptional regulator [Pseudomonadales bacterium]
MNAPEVNPKINIVIDIVKSNPSSNISNAELAAAVDLSERQLQRQFKIATGIPIRRFRLWHRLFITATLMQFGWSLTDAALEAGFSDAPHFNHTFRSMLGMKPSFVLKRQNKIKIFAGSTDTQPETLSS